MLLLIACGIATLWVLIDPYWNRVANTSLWIGRALTEEDFETTGGSLALPKIIQGALMEGYPSTMCLIVAFLPYVTGAMSLAVGFFYAWWAGVLLFFIPPLLRIYSGRTSISSHYLEHYIMYFMIRLARRRADYKAKGDLDRSEAADSLYNDLVQLLAIYANSGVIAPWIKRAESAPCGKTNYLIDLKKE